MIKKLRAARVRLPPSFLLGAFTPRIDYSAQMISVGHWRRASVDLGDRLPIGEKIRMSLSGPVELEKNQCDVLHLTESYEWVPQGRPRRPPSLTRARNAGM